MESAFFGSSIERRTAAAADNMIDAGYFTVMEQMDMPREDPLHPSTRFCN